MNSYVLISLIKWMINTAFNYSCSTVIFLLQAYCLLLRVRMLPTNFSNMAQQLELRLWLTRHLSKIGYLVSACYKKISFPCMFISACIVGLGQNFRSVQQWMNRWRDTKASRLPHIHTYRIVLFENSKFNLSDKNVLAM